MRPALDGYVHEGKLEATTGFEPVNRGFADSEPAPEQPFRSSAEHGADRSETVPSPGSVVKVWSDDTADGYSGIELITVNGWTRTIEHRVAYLCPKGHLSYGAGDYDGWDTDDTCPVERSWVDHQPCGGLLQQVGVIDCPTGKGGSCLDDEHDWSSNQHIGRVS